MNRIALIIFTFNISFLLNANDSFFSPVTKLTEKITSIPVKLAKELGKKITVIGGKELLFGATAAAIFTEGLTDNSKKNKEIIKSNNLVKINAKGQINMNGLNENEAQRRALEDALYFASMKAGVKVQGFSSIDEKTSLNESFIVKPNNQILDYRIIKSYKDSENYIVEVEAIIGNLKNTDQVCNERKILNIKEFKADFIVNTNTPSWAYNYLAQILYFVRRNMLNDNEINYVDNTLVYYDLNQDNFDKSYDYLTLVNGSQSINNGDYIYIPSMSIKKSKINPKFYTNENVNNNSREVGRNFFDADALGILSKIDIYDGKSNRLVASVEEEYLIPINIDSNFEFIELFSKKDKVFITNELKKVSKDLFQNIKKKLICEPIVAKIELKNNRLQVPLGALQGLRENQLAVLKNKSGNDVTMLSISEIGDYNAILSPLNSSLKLENFSGKETRFLE